MADQVPAWLLSAPSAAPREDGSSEPWIAAALAAPEVCRPGQQEETLARLSWWAARTLDQDIASAVLSQWVVRLPLGDPRDPWDSTHVNDHLDRAFAKYTPPGSVTGLDAGPTLDVTTLFLNPADMVWSDQDWIVEHFVSPGTCSEIVGKVKKGKSTLVYQMIASCVFGQPFLGKSVVKTPVVLLTEQVGNSLKKTLERAGLLGVRDLYVLTKDKLKAAGGWEGAADAAIRLCLRVGARLLVVDTLSRLAGMAGDAENKAGAVKVLDVLDAARSAHISCVLVRHARKGTPGYDDDAADIARGSSAITGDMDIIIQLKPYGDESEDYRRLTFQSRITDDPEPIYLEYQDGVYAVVEKPAGKGERKADVRLQRVADAELKLGGESASDRAVALETGMSHPTVAKYRKRLREGAAATGVN